MATLMGRSPPDAVVGGASAGATFPSDTGRRVSVVRRRLVAPRAHYGSGVTCTRGRPSSPSAGWEGSWCSRPSPRTRSSFPPRSATSSWDGSSVSAAHVRPRVPCCRRRWCGEPLMGEPGEVVDPVVAPEMVSGADGLVELFRELGVWSELSEEDRESRFAECLAGGAACPSTMTTMFPATVRTRRGRCPRVRRPRAGASRGVGIVPSGGVLRR